MFEKITHFLTGYIEIVITGGDRLRFLNILMKKGLRLWGYRKTIDAIYVKVRADEYRKILKLKGKLSIIVTRKRKIGVPFLFFRFMKRPGLFVGTIVSIFLLLFLKSRYWVIDVSSSGVYSEQKILATAQDCGIYTGVAISDINERKAILDMMIALPELTWVSVNTYGSNIEIAVEYKVEKPEIIDKDSCVNIIANETGVVTSIVAQQGVPIVEVGEAVEKGEVLISGTWDTNRNKNEWELEENPQVFHTNARGEVMAETDRLFRVNIPKIKTELSKTDTYSKYEFGFFGLNLPFTFSLVPNGDYELFEKQNNLYLLGTKLPIYFKTQELTKIEKETLFYKNGEVENLLKNLIIKQQQTIGTGNKILEQGDLVISEDENYYIGEMHCKCLVNIAKEDIFSTN